MTDRNSKTASELESLRVEEFALLQSKDRNRGELEVERERSRQLAEQLRQSEEQKVKTERELERLRQHLLQVEIVSDRIGSGDEYRAGRCIVHSRWRRTILEKRSLPRNERQN